MGKLRNHVGNFYQVRTTKEIRENLKKQTDKHTGPGHVSNNDYGGRTTSEWRDADAYEDFFEPQIIERDNTILGMSYFRG